MTTGVNPIWRVPAYLPYLQPALTEKAIVDAEYQLGFPLPRPYLDLLRSQNGGYIRVSLPKLPHNVIAGIGPNYPSLTDCDWAESQECVSFSLDGLVPFDGDGHWHLCFDYRETPTNPSITYIDIECDQQVSVAESFATYLTLLQVDCSDDYVVDTVSNIEDLTSSIAAKLNRAFDPPDCWAHGYALYRAQLGTTAKPEWLWVSSNEAPRGFVRDDDDRFAELQHLLPGFALRFPELPENSYILSATNGARAKVLNVCSDLQLSIRPMREYLVNAK